MNIKDLPLHERPREKLMIRGPENLKNHEIMAILLRIGREGKNALEVAQEILKKYPMKQLLSMSYSDLVSVKGIDSGKACTLLAAKELIKRALEVNDTSLPVLLTPDAITAQLTHLRGLKKEHFVVLYVNSRYHLLGKETISVGTLTASVVHPREVFEPALKYMAASVILAHNHPSGDLTPSPGDKAVTKRLVKAGSILGIEVLDHLIITDAGYLSFKQKGLIE